METMVADLEVRAACFLNDDPGAVRYVYVLRGGEGAVHFVYADWHPNTPADQRSIDTKFMINFGHPLYPLGNDVGYHARAPMFPAHFELGPADAACLWLDGDPCWADGSALRGRELLTLWLAHDRDLEFLYGCLAIYYHSVFRSGGEAEMGLTEMLAGLAGLFNLDADDD